MASAVVLKAKIVGTEIVRGFDLVKEWGQAFNTKPLIPMAGIIANEEYFHAHKAEFDLLHQDLSDALNWVMANRKVRLKLAPIICQHQKPLLKWV